MSLYNNYYNFNSSAYSYSPNFRGETASAPLARPIEKVENIVNSTVDTFIPIEPSTEEEKKSKHTAIKVLSSGLVLGTLLLAFNPKSSGKMMNKFHELAKIAEEKSKDNSSFTGKIYKWCGKFFNGASKWMQLVNNGNSLKDERFKHLCTKEKTFINNINNDSCRNIAKTIDSSFVKVMGKAHNGITRAFDSLGKKTVFRKYKNVNSDMSQLDELIITYKSKLSPKELKKFEEKMLELKRAQGYFGEKNTETRLLNQEKIMKNLESDFNMKRKIYFNKFATNPKDYRSWNRQNLNQDYAHVKNNLDFWAENLVKPQRDTVEKNGKKAVDTLMGDGAKIKGVYNEILEIISPHMKPEEKEIITQSIRKTREKLRKANKSECTDYFNKKRDLILGSAPTDILTAIIGFGASGIAISSADSKEDKLSKALTVGLPVIGTLGTSMILTSMLFSGTQGLLLGNLAGLGINKIGSTADKYLIKKDNYKTNA